MFEKPYIGILTSLMDFSSAYSLTGVIKDQARLFKKYGYKYDILVNESFNEQDKASAETEGLSVRYVLPATHLPAYKTYEKPFKDFHKNVDTYYKGAERGIGYEEAVAPYDIIITHDLMFLNCYLPLNQAVRKCIERYPDKKWLHWFHSSPSPRPKVNEDNPVEVEGVDMCYPTTLRYTVAPNSKYVFLNKSKKQDLANMLLVESNAIRVVNNTKDIRDVLNFRSDTCGFIDRYNLFDHFVCQTYAFSTPRWKSKGVDRLLKLFGEWKKAKAVVKLILVNAHCTQDEDRARVEEIKAFAVKECSLVVGKDVIFTSEYAEEKIKEYHASYPPRSDEAVGAEAWEAWRYSVPNEVVTELTAMSNMFVFPSVSECCSLIQAEASVLGKFMVLNRDFYPMREFCSEETIHYEFNSNDPKDNPLYYECAAREIMSNFLNDVSVMNSTEARNETYNKDWIFKKQIEPLLYEGFSE